MSFQPSTVTRLKLMRPVESRQHFGLILHGHVLDGPIGCEGVEIDA
jgi:hypothetical protein